MSDSPLEEMEAHEHAEHAEHAADEGGGLLSQVTMTIAVMAVVAAIGGSLEETEGDKTIADKNTAVLLQNQATDTWNEFEAKSTKKNLYQLFSDQGGPRAADYAKEVTKNVADQAKLMKKAKDFEAKRDAASEDAEHHEVRHGRLTIASTLLHMAIAIATLSIILRRRWPWLASLGLAVLGVALAVWAYL
jgi:hypothetical protein